MATVRSKAVERGFSARASSLLAESRRVSTLKVYNSRLAAFNEWCEERGFLPKETSCPVIADFLIHLFDKGLSLSTIRGYRSAIAAIHNGFPDGSRVSDSLELGHLLRSFFLKRPSSRPLAPSWSLPKVLETLARPPFEPMCDASFHNLTVKTVLLIALASGHRRSSLHALTTAEGHIRFEARGVRLRPETSFIAKNQSDVSGPVEIFLSKLSTFSSVPEDKTWCPVRALKWYLSKAKSLRSNDKLFVITKKPFSAASPSTISRWIVEGIKAAGPEALLSGREPRAHDTRSISSSWALFAGVSTPDIMKAAFWRSKNSFISFYLRDVCPGEERFGASVLSAAASRLPKHS